jgi:hypothetical protein
LPDAAAGLDIEEVVEEAFVSGGVWFRPLGKLVQKPQLLPNSFSTEWPEEHAALDGKREGRQGHTHGCDAARGGGIGFVPDQPIVGIGFMQVEEQRGPLHPVQVRR